MSTLHEESGPTYAIFPYIKTSKSVVIRGITLRSTDDLDGLEQTDQENLRLLSKMFYIRDGVRIKRMVYAILDSTLTEIPLLTQSIWECHQLLAFIYGPMFSSESATVFTMRRGVESPWMVLPSTDDHNTIWEGAWPEGFDESTFDVGTNIPAFVGRRNLSDQWITERINGKIYPPCSRPVLNIPQDLMRDLTILCQSTKRWAISRLLSSDPSVDTKDQFIQRVFRSISWFNMSHNATVDRPEPAIVFLATAFESLLNLELKDVASNEPYAEGATDKYVSEVATGKPPEGIKHRFITALNMLLGNIPRLNSWAEQFYNARNKVVHEGQIKAVHFVAGIRKEKKSKSESPLYLGKLTEMGSEIFRLCLAAMLSGHYSAVDAALDKYLVHNEERLLEVCKRLGQKTESPGDRLKKVEAIIADLHEFRFSFSGGPVDLNALLNAGRLLCQTVRERHPTLPPECTGLMDNIEQIQTNFGVWEVSRPFNEFAKATFSLSSSEVEGDLILVKALSEFANQTVLMGVTRLLTQ